MISRRKLLQSSMIGFGGMFLTSQNIETAQISPSGVKITNVKPYQFKKATFVKIETNADISGWGEADHDHPDVWDLFCR